MTMYESVFNKLQERVNSGELTLEDANRLNDYAYKKYVVEAEEVSKDEELIGALLQKVQDGFKLPKKVKEAIEDVMKDDDDSDDNKSEEPAEDSEDAPAEE